MDAVDANGFTGQGLRMVIDQSQNTGNAILVEDDAAVALFQLDENGGLTLGAASAQTTAITITDTDYTNALSIGDNNITGTTYAISGTTATISFTDFGVDNDGKVTLSPDSAGDAFSITSAAADIQGIVIDASTNDSTQTAGMIQITSDTVTNNAILGLGLTGNVRDSSGNLTAIYGNKMTITVDTDASQSQTVYGSHITMDNDDASSTVYGLFVDADGDGGGTGTEYAAVFTDGNVGIGNTTPAQALFMGTTTAGQNIGIGYGGDILFYDSGGALNSDNTITNYLSSVGSSNWILIGGDNMSKGASSIHTPLAILNNSRMLYNWDHENNGGYAIDGLVGFGANNTANTQTVLNLYNTGTAATSTGAALSFDVNRTTS